MSELIIEEYRQIPIKQTLGSTYADLGNNLPQASYHDEPTHVDDTQQQLSASGVLLLLHLSLNIDYPFWFEYHKQLKLTHLHNSLYTQKES